MHRARRTTTGDRRSRLRAGGPRAAQASVVGLVVEGACALQSAGRRAACLLAALVALPAFGASGEGPESGSARSESSGPAPVEAPAPGRADSFAVGLDDPPPETRECRRIVKIEIRKWDHVLRATCSEGHVREFKVALGRRPFGDKQRQGDMRTPEGYYRIAEPPRSSQFHVFMPIDYPSAVDADAALTRGDITPETYLSIVRAVLRDEMPPQHTALGGAIGLHGEGAEHQGWTRDRDWTFGCVALSDGDAAFLAARVEVGTAVWIRP